MGCIAGAGCITAVAFAKTAAEGRVVRCVAAGGHGMFSYPYTAEVRQAMGMRDRLGFKTADGQPLQVSAAIQLRLGRALSCYAPGMPACGSNLC